MGAFPLPAPATSKSSTKPSSSSTPRKSPQRTNSKGDRKQQQQKQQAGGGGSGRDDDGDWAWGLRARLVTATSYTVFDDAVEEPWLGVRVAYRETVCLPLVHPWIGSGAVSLGACVRMDHR